MDTGSPYSVGPTTPGGPGDEGSQPLPPTPPPPPPKPPLHPPVLPPPPGFNGQIPGGIAARGFATRRDIGKLGSGRVKTFKSKKGGQIVTVFFNIRDQVKMYHWQTKSFAEHKATDDLVGTLDTNIDKFVEAYMGRYGRPLIKKTLPVKNLTVSGIRAFIARSSTWLSTKLPRMVKRTDTDLLNIRDEILADLNQIKYLFTLS